MFTIQIINWRDQHSLDREELHQKSKATRKSKYKVLGNVCEQVGM